MREARAERRRAMYAHGRADARARRSIGVARVLTASGLFPRSWALLLVRGRTSGQIRSFPLAMADLDGEWYLVSMLGECAWVSNVRAAHGRAALRGRMRGAIGLTEVDVAHRAPILKRYLQVAPGARPHFTVDRHDPIEAFEAIAGRHPVFRVVWVRERRAA